MKKLLLFATCVAFSAMAMATDLSGVKIYLNPGHGGWNEMNDRHIGTIPFPTRTPDGMCDTLGFWESSSNLKVAYDLKEMLEAAGATVKMSRLTNQSGTRDDGELDWDMKRINYDKTGQGGATKTVVLDPLEGDRSLAGIAQEATTWGADFFLSIHSNASSVGVAANYVVCFMPCNQFANPDGSWDMNESHVRDPQDLEYAKTMWNYIIDNPLDCYHEGTYPDQPRCPAVSEYTLLAYGNLGVPGFICEASFHSYLPNTHRYLNRDYQRLEAYRFFRGICAMFDADQPTTAVIAGDVRSANFKETRNGMGAYIVKPINHDIAKDKWRPMDGTLCELLQNGQVIDTYMTDNYCNGMYMFDSVTPGNYQVRISAPHAVPQTIDVVATAGRTNTYNTFVVDSSYIRPLTPDYPNLAADATLPDKFIMNEFPIVPTPFLDGLNIRRMMVRGEKTYVLDDQSHIYIVDTYTGAQIGQIKTSSLTAGTLAVSDFGFTSDSMLVACNQVTITSDEKTEISIYYWENDDADPKVLYTMHNKGGFRNDVVAGEHIAVCGNIWWNRVFYTIHDTTKKLYAICGAEWHDPEGTGGMLEQSLNHVDNTAYSEKKWGNDFSMLTAPTDMSHSFFILDSKDIILTEYNFDWTQADKKSMSVANTVDAKKLNVGSCGVSFVQYAGQNMMIVPVCDEGGVNFGLQLFDMTTNKDADLIIAMTNSRSDKMPQAGLNAAAVDFIQSGAVVEGEDLNLVVYLKGIGIARFSTSEYTGLEDVYRQSSNFNHQSFDILGRPATDKTQGVIIRDGNKYMKH